MGKASSLEDYRQITHFQTLRKTLLQDQFSADLEKPLAYWALPSDRRLPLAFLGRTLRDLLNAPLEELAATPGIGHKKISSLLKLLSRAAKKKPPDDAHRFEEAPAEDKSSAIRNLPQGFNPEEVSEALWEQWRDKVRRQDLGSEKLGRLAPALQLLPLITWNTPLSSYLDYSVAELRQLKTHGEKRVRAILEVFYTIYEVVGHAPVKSHLAFRLLPKFVIPLEASIATYLESTDRVTLKSIRESIAVPLTEQIRIDCGSAIAKLVEGRLGIQTAHQSVRIQAKRMGITRARVYQLLGECQQAMAVRWPEGRSLLTRLQQKLESLQPRPESAKFLRTVMELFFLVEDGSLHLAEKKPSDRKNQLAE